MLLRWYNIVGLEMFLNVVLNDGFPLQMGEGETNRTVVINSSAISSPSGVTRAFFNGLKVPRTPKTS